MELERVNIENLTPEASLKILEPHFPSFVKKLRRHSETNLEFTQPGISDADLASIESSIGCPLPEIYKTFLRSVRELWLIGGAIQFGPQHPFVHSFQPYAQQPHPFQHDIKSQNYDLICFAEYCLEADGDQVVFDVSQGLIDAEYPVLYYAHETRPPSVRKLFDSFSGFLNGFLDGEQSTPSPA